MNKDFWNKHYKEHKFNEQSTFAEYAIQFIDGPVVDLGCGDGRDVYFFKRKGLQAHGVDGSNEDEFILKQDVLAYIHQNQSPENVYTRFFWHAISREEQLAILKWVKKRLFIEARTKEDKPLNLYGKHKRNLIDVKRLISDLEDNGFVIVKFLVGHGMSVLNGEDPHLVRIVAEKA